MRNPNLVRVAIRFHKAQLEKIDKVRTLNNKYCIDGKVFSTRNDYLHAAFEEKVKQDTKRINRMLKKQGKLDEMIK